MNRADLDRREAAEDRYALECETWDKYAERVGIAADVGKSSDGHVKQVGETWDEYMARTAVRDAYLSAKFAEMDRQKQAEEHEVARRAQASDRVVKLLQEYEAALEHGRTQPRHHLFVDFDHYQQLKFGRERDALDDEHALLREYVCLCEKEARLHLARLGDMSRSICALLIRERQERENEEQRRREEEAACAAEKQRLVEEARRMEDEARVRKTREEAEQAKRLERKRRDDERRARLRAEVTATQMTSPPSPK